MAVADVTIAATLNGVTSTAIRIDVPYAPVGGGRTVGATEYPPPYHVPELESHEWQNWLTYIESFIRAGAQLDFYSFKNANLVRVNLGVWTTVVSTGAISINKSSVVAIQGNSYLTGSSGATVAGMQHRLLKDGVTVLHSRRYNKPNIEFYDDSAGGTHTYELQRYVSAGFADYRNCTLTVYSL